MIHFLLQRQRRFQISILIFFDHSTVSQMAPATPEKCRGKFSGMMVELSRVIGNWERSGQGDGGAEKEDDSEEEAGPEQVQFGALRNRERGALDRRASFVPCSASYLLYLWHMLDKHDLLRSSMQRLDEGVAAGNGGSGVPSVILRRGESDDGGTANSVLSSKQDEISRLLYQGLKELGEKTDKASQRDAEEREKGRVQQRVLFLETGIETLEEKKRKLSVEIEQHKKSKTMVDILQGQLEDVIEKTRRKELELAKLVDYPVEVGDPASTPWRHNRSPD